MSSTTAVRSPRGVQARNASQYTELSERIKAAGLLERRPVWYVIRCTLLLLAYVALFAALFAASSSPWQLLVAAGFALVFTQTAFLAHDGAHKQVFSSGKHNELFSRIAANLFVGLSYGWWMNKHSRHHANPNKIGKDGDIAPGAIVFTADDAAQRHGIRAWIMARQHWFFLPILSLSGLDLHVSAVRAVLGREDVKHRRLEASLLAIRLLGFPALVLIVAGPGMGAAFMAVQVLLFGFTMGGSFAPNHKGMPVVPKDLSIDFLRRQTLTSRNISGGPLVTLAMGGLNYQIEHHLFPSMPSINLGRARPIVQEYCRERDIRYTETSFVGSYRIVLEYLKRVGLKHADPFDCPTAAQFR